MYHLERLTAGNWHTVSTHFTFRLAQEAHFIACGASPEFKLFDRVWDHDAGHLKIVETHQNPGHMNPDLRIHQAA